MKFYFKIRKDKLSNYNNLENGFVKFPCQLSSTGNISNDKKIYYYWRLRNNSQDEIIVTPIKFEDLELISVYS